MSPSFGTAKTIRLIGGSAVLDFINTCNGRRPDSSLDTVEDRLNSFQFFFDWALHASLLSAEEYEEFKPLVADPLMSYQPCLDSTVVFREALFNLFYKFAQGQEIVTDDLYLLDMTLQKSLPLRQLAIINGLPAWRWKKSLTATELTLMLSGRLAIEAINLFTSADLQQLKCCSSLGCDWLFLDVSKNKQRRWCQMSVCGSREKLSRVKQTGNLVSGNS